MRTTGAGLALAVVLAAGSGAARGQVLGGDLSVRPASALTLGGQAGSASLAPQGPGSLSTTYSGVVGVAALDLSAGTITFSTSTTALTAANSGSWSPGVNGVAGAAPADYGGVFDYGANGSVTAAVRNLTAGVTTGAPAPLTAVSPGRYTFPVDQTLAYTGASAADFRGTGLVGSSVGFGREALDGSNVNAGGTGTLVDLGGGVYEITYPVSLTVTDTFNGLPVTLTLDGTVEAQGALAPVPEPAGALGLAAVVAGGWGYRRRAGPGSRPVPPGPGRRPGLSAVEVLVCLAAGAVLVGLLLPAVQKVRGAAAGAGCRHNLREVGLALHAHHDGHGALPPAFSTRDRKYLGWLARLLPEVEQGGLWAEADAAYRAVPLPWAGPPHPIGRVVRGYACPADPAAARPAVPPNLTVGAGLPVSPTVAGSSYLGVSGTDLDARDGVLWVDSRTRLTDIADGTSQTAAAGERPPPADLLYGWWYAGPGQDRTGSADVTLGVREVNRSVAGCPPGRSGFGPAGPADRCGVLHFWSHHPGGAHFLLADGAVRFVSYAGGAVLPALATARAGDGGGD